MRVASPRNIAIRALSIRVLAADRRNGRVDDDVSAPPTLGALTARSAVSIRANNDVIVGETGRRSGRRAIRINREVSRIKQAMSRSCRSAPVLTVPLQLSVPPDVSTKPPSPDCAPPFAKIVPEARARLLAETMTLPPLPVLKPKRHHGGGIDRDGGGFDTVYD